jgi:hypothetical protein
MEDGLCPDSWCIGGAPVRFNKHAWASLVIGSSCVLAGCESFSGAAISVGAPTPVDPACVDWAVQFVGPVDKFARIQEQTGAVEYNARRGIQSVSVMVIEGPPPSIQMESSWKGKSSDDMEIASLRLLEDVYNAILKSCDIREPPATISTRCSTRHCDGWLKR